MSLKENSKRKITIPKTYPSVDLKPEFIKEISDLIDNEYEKIEDDFYKEIDYKVYLDDDTILEGDNCQDFISDSDTEKIKEISIELSSQNKNIDISVRSFNKGFKITANANKHKDWAIAVDSELQKIFKKYVRYSFDEGDSQDKTKYVNLSQQFSRTFESISITEDFANQLTEIIQEEKKRMDLEVSEGKTSKENDLRINISLKEGISRETSNLEELKKYCKDDAFESFSLTLNSYGLTNRYNPKRKIKISIRNYDISFLVEETGISIDATWINGVGERLEKLFKIHTGSLSKIKPFNKTLIALVLSISVGVVIGYISIIYVPDSYTEEEISGIAALIISFVSLISAISFFKIESFLGKLLPEIETSHIIKRKSTFMNRYILPILFTVLGLFLSLLFT